MPHRICVNQPTPYKWLEDTAATAQEGGSCTVVEMPKNGLFPADSVFEIDGTIVLRISIR
jgi:hypothetical protein